jgi:hypothetical protein
MIRKSSVLSVLPVFLLLVGCQRSPLGPGVVISEGAAGDVLRVSFFDKQMLYDYSPHDFAVEKVQVLSGEAPILVRELPPVQAAPGVRAPPATPAAGARAAREPSGPFEFTAPPDARELKLQAVVLEGGARFDVRVTFEKNATSRPEGRWKAGKTEIRQMNPGAPSLAQGD